VTTLYVILLAKTLGDIVSDDGAGLIVVGAIKASNTALRTRWPRMRDSG